MSNKTKTQLIDAIAVERDQENYFGLNIEDKLTMLIGQTIVNHMVPYKQYANYNTFDIIYKEVEVIDEDKKIHYKTIKLFSPLTIGRLEESDFSNPAKVKEIVNLGEIMKTGGGPSDEELTAKINEAISSAQYVAISDTKPTNPNTKLWIKKLSTKTMYTENGIL